MNFNQISISDLPCSAWCKDLELNYVSVNEQFLNLTRMQFDSILSFNDYDLPWEKFASEYRDADKQVITGQPLAILHPIALRDGRQITVISRKSVIRNDVKNPIGVMGIVTLVSNQKLIEFSRILQQVDTEYLGECSQQYVLEGDSNTYSLTSREQECLFYLLRGKTSKEIGIRMGLSFRTIEGHIENLKFKFNCSKKSELIEKAIQAGFSNIIPKRVLFQNNNRDSNHKEI